MQINENKQTNKEFFFGSTRIVLDPTYFHSGWKITIYVVLIIEFVCCDI